MKKITNFIITSLVFFSILSNVSAQVVPFPDVDPNDIFMPEIQYLKDNGLANGYPDGTYRSGATINRGEFTKLLINAKFDDDQISGCIVNYGYFEEQKLFNDVGLNDTFSRFICMGRAFGIVKGYSDGTYRPKENITYGQALKIAMRTLDPAVANQIPVDAALVQYNLRMNNYNARPESINEYDLEHVVTRGEAAHIIQRVHSNYTAI